MPLFRSSMNRLKKFIINVWLITHICSTLVSRKKKVTTSDNAVLIDCRPKEDYAHGHVAGAINFPIEKITEERVCRRLPDKTTGLYIIGSYYHKPNVAMKKFKKLGYKNLHFSGFMEEHHGMLTR